MNSRKILFLFITKVLFVFKSFNVYNPTINYLISLIKKGGYDIAKAFEGVSEDLGYKVKVIYTDPSNSPQLIGVDENGNEYIKDGTAYVDKKTGIGYILVNTESPANSTKAGVIGTIAEEQSHVIGKFEGRTKSSFRWK